MAATRRPAAEVWRAASALLFDCDGVLWHGERVVPGAAAALAAAREAGKRVLFVTNSASRTRRELAAKLERLGLDGAPEDVHTSAHAAARFLSAQRFAKKAFIVGMGGVETELNEAGIRTAGGVRYEALAPGGGLPTEDAAHSVELDPEVGAVVCGFDANVTYAKLAHASLLLRYNPGCQFVATNMDATATHSNGRQCPAAGMFVEALRVASGREPTLVGKPDQSFLDGILEQHGLDRESTVMVGDRLDTDVEFGRRGGLQTLLVLSGVTSAGQLAAGVPPVQEPTAVADSLADLP